MERFCKNCNMKIHPENNYCTNCGLGIIYKKDKKGDEIIWEENHYSWGMIIFFRFMLSILLLVISIAIPLRLLSSLNEGNYRYSSLLLVSGIIFLITIYSLKFIVSESCFAIIFTEKSLYLKGFFNKRYNLSQIQHINIIFKKREKRSGGYYTKYSKYWRKYNFFFKFVLFFFDKRIKSFSFELSFESNQREFETMKKYSKYTKQEFIKLVNITSKEKYSEFIKKLKELSTIFPKMVKIDENLKKL